MKKNMVAVPITQGGATRLTFDVQRFGQEMVDPVKAFLVEAGDEWTVLLFSCGGSAPEYEALGRHYPPECEQPPFPSTPSHEAAMKYFTREFEKGTVWLVVLTGEELRNPERVLEAMMRERGAGDPRILPASRLMELVAETPNAT